jgi:porin
VKRHSTVVSLPTKYKSGAENLEVGYTPGKSAAVQYCTVFRFDNTQDRVCLYSSPTPDPRSRAQGRSQRFLLCIGLYFCIFVFPVLSQILEEETLAGPDAHETAENTKGYLFGDWGGVRTRLLERGVKLDLHSISDALWNIRSQQNERFASYNRVRGTVDIDLGTLVHQQGWSFHATAVWQTGDNLGSYLGLVANPSSIASMNTFRLDSWWFQKSWLKNRISARAGQFAGQDSYGNQNFGKSFVVEPIGGSLDNLSNTFETFDPPSTPALEIRVVLIHNVYMKSMVSSADRLPFSNNPTGMVPYFHGPPVSISEIGFTPGKKASSMVPTDNATSRKGYSGLTSSAPLAILGSSLCR